MQPALTSISQKKKKRLNATTNAEPAIPERVFPEGWSEERMRKDHPKKSVTLAIYLSIHFPWHLMKT